MEKTGALILAAGKGTRLAPLTLCFPKPALPLTNGKTILSTIIEKIQKITHTGITVNTFHHSDLLNSYLKKTFPEIHISHEKELLNTGGAFIKAREKLRESDTLILHNGDILSNLDLNALLQHHQQHQNILTLALIQGPENRILTRTNDKGFIHVVDVGGRLGATEANTQSFTYMGIAVFDKTFLNYFPEAVQPYDLRMAFVDAIRAGERVGGYLAPEGTYWSDLGTLEKYQEAEIYLRPQSVRNDIESPNQFYPLQQQGSARMFYRLKAEVDASHHGNAQILMVSHAEDVDFKRFITFSKYLRDAGCNVPEIYAYNAENYAVLMEDLGETTVRQALDQHGIDLSEIYAKIIAALVHYNTAHTRVPPDNLEGLREFDYDYLRWETTYFRENFIERYAHYTYADGEKEALDAEFDFLARKVYEQPKVWMHRDCQSQNIMLTPQNQIGFVDFQGGRIGPLAYDLMSLLYDPYMPELAPYRDTLAELYRTQYVASQKISLSKETFQNYAHEAALQRLMQALGAYTFLALIKGKKHYLKFIPEAVSAIETHLEFCESFPVLKHILCTISRSFNCLNH